MTKPNGNKIGRPKKTDIAELKAGNRGKVGRPAGDAAIINEYKARMLASPKSAKVLEKILDAALNDEHQHQAAAWRLVVDRILPVSAFDQAKQGGGQAAVTINISGLTNTNVSSGDQQTYDITDVELKD
jgi:hypothetical protein